MEVTLRLAPHPRRPGFYQTHLVDQEGNVWSNTLESDGLAFETIVEAVILAQKGAETFKLKDNDL